MERIMADWIRPDAAGRAAGLIVELVKKKPSLMAAGADRVVRREFSTPAIQRPARLSHPCA
jgi:hypothetical protein